MQLKLFRAGSTDALESEVNAWLKVNGDRIDIEHTQITTSLEPNGAAKPGTVYIASIWYFEITKR
jgi:hypothetical protein